MSNLHVSGLGPLNQAIIRVGRLHRAYAGRLLREVGLHAGQELVLMSLWADGPQRQVDLVAAIGSDPPTMTRSLARLEKAGLVRRTRDPGDGRAILVEATAESEALRARVAAVWEELERISAGTLTPRQQRELEQGLLAVEANLQPGE